MKDKSSRSHAHPPTPDSTMTLSLLHRATVLVLNRNWQAIHAVTPADAFGYLTAGTARALRIQGLHDMQPLDWETWRTLSPIDGEASVGTTTGRVVIPTVIVLSRYDRVPLVQPAFNLRGVWERDGGRCQYSGRAISAAEASIDHVMPRSRGGADDWENCVLSDRAINHRKGARTPTEAGLRLLSVPRAPRPVPSTLRIRNLHQIGDWNHFLQSPSRSRQESTLFPTP